MVTDELYHMDDVRPFWGEHEAVIAAPEWQPAPAVRTTFAERREARISDGLCPLPGCGGSLDEDFFCSMCGQVSLPGRDVTVATSWSLLTDDDQLTLDEAA